MSDALTKPKIMGRTGKKKETGAATAELFPEFAAADAPEEPEEVYDPEPDPEPAPARLAPQKSVPKEEPPKTVPSIFPNRDPEFSRPIFNKKRPVPGQPVNANANEGIAKPRLTPPPPKLKPRRPEAAFSAPPSPLPVKKYETGVLGLDNRIGGLSAGSFNCISGVEGVSRSQLVAHIAERLAMQDARVLAVISPHEEDHWNAMPNLSVRVAVKFSLDDLLSLVDETDRTNVIIIDPLHSLQTPPEQERIAAMDYAVTQFANYARRRRQTIITVPQPVDRASRHEGVSLHPWMFRDISCLMDLSELILMVRTHRMGQQEILAYRRGMKNRIGGLPSFVIPWQ